MNGAESLIRTAAAAGVDVCFTNPGTTEMHLVAALDSEPGVRGVLGLFEGVITGAADGYGRMAESPAMTLLHLGPGFANGIANLHNARRAQTPIVNLIGHHATWQRNYDPPLNSDVETLAAPVSAWQRTNASAEHLARDLAAAVTASLEGPGQISTLVVPADCQWNPAPETVVSPSPAARISVAAQSVERTAELLRMSGDQVTLLLGAHALRSTGLVAAARIAHATGCRLVSETFPARLERGPALPVLDRLPYFPEQAQDFLAGCRHLVLVGALDPVSFFGYENGPSRLAPETTVVHTLAGRREDAAGALTDLATALEANEAPATRSLEIPRPPSGELDAETIGRAIASAQPEGAIVIDEGVTAIGGYLPASVGCAPHTVLSLTGGAIGWGMPCAVGAAIACPDRKVIALEGDGSALYTVQSLWTQAREQLDIVNVVFQNDIYRILQIELHRTGVEHFGDQSRSLTQLSNPKLDWEGLAKGFGVPSRTVSTAEDLYAGIAEGVAEDGPRLVIVQLSPR